MKTLTETQKAKRNAKKREHRKKKIIQLKKTDDLRINSSSKSSKSSKLKESDTIKIVKDHNSWRDMFQAAHLVDVESEKLVSGFKHDIITGNNSNNSNESSGIEISPTSKPTNLENKHKDRNRKKKGKKGDYDNDNDEDQTGAFCQPISIAKFTNDLEKLEKKKKQL